MLLSELLKKSERSAFHLWILNNILWKKIPFNNPHKIKIEKIENGALTVSIPYKRKNQNHIKGIHACALATLCEYITGMTLASSISEKEYRIILKNISITYHYQAKMKVQTTFSLSQEFIQKEIIEPLKMSDSIFKELTVELYDIQKNHICTGLINWQIKKWEKSKNKNHMTKKNNFKRCILVTISLISFCSCMTIEPVEVRNVDNFQLKDVMTNPSVQFDVSIHNPNSFGLTLKEFKSTAFLGDKMVTDIFIEKKIHIGANSDISIPFQTQPSLNDIAGMVFSGNGSKDLKVEGFLVVKKFIFRKKFPFSIRTKI